MVRESVLAGAVALLMLGAQSQQSIPDAPKPQTLPSLGTVTPGKGTTATSNGDTSSTVDGQDNAPGTSLPSTRQPTADDGPPPEVPTAGNVEKVFTLRGAGVNFVDVPFTVKDSKGQLVPGITWRDVRVYENGYRQQISVFTSDPLPLSVALVIDQSMPFDTMAKVNNALGAMQGAFAPYDEIAVFTYNNGPKMQTDFTAAQGARLGAVLERSKSPGREAAMNYTSGPLSQNININEGAQSHIDPNTNASHGTQLTNTLNVPKEVHTLNDAILAAGASLSKVPRGRRRIIYVISDGKEYGSTAKYKDVVRYLQENKIAVWGTLVGDSSVPGLGFMDRIHLPLTMRDNILPLYTGATGGLTDPEFRTKGIENSFAKITEEVRTQYTVGYYSHESFLDGKYRTLEVRIMRPNLSVYAKPGYFPTAADAGTAPPIRPNTN